MTNIDSTSDQRVRNNVVRHEYRVLTQPEKDAMKAVKDATLVLHELITGLGSSREISLALTRVEEASMWAVKHITK